MSFKKSRLHVDDQPYQAPIKKLTPKQIVPNKKLEDALIAVKHVSQSDEAMENGSKLIGYTAEMSSVEDAHHVYIKVKRNNIHATHVICAYCLKIAQGVDKQGMVDDGEIGTARRLMYLMKKCNLTM